MKKTHAWWKTAITIFAAFVHLAPFYIALTIALKPKSDLSSRWMLPTELFTDNFKLALESANIVLAMRNSIIITAISVVLVMLIGAMAAYPLSRVKTKFNAMVLLLVVGIMMVPPLSILVPLLRLLKTMGLISTFPGIIVVLTTFYLPLSIFLYSNFIGNIPLSLDESATIDGCNKLQTFWHVILPLLKPVTASVVILTGVQIWNDYQFSLYLLQKGRDESCHLGRSFLLRRLLSQPWRCSRCCTDRHSTNRHPLHLLTEVLRTRYG